MELVSYDSSVGQGQKATFDCFGNGEGSPSPRLKRAKSCLHKMLMRRPSQGIGRLRPCIARCCNTAQVRLGRLHLLAYQRLANDALGDQPARLLYFVRPKHHYTDHLVTLVAKTSINIMQDPSLFDRFAQVWHATHALSRSRKCCKIACGNSRHDP